MALDPSLAFEANDGVILSEDGPGLFSGSSTPIDPAPSGSMFFQSDGTFYQYVGGIWVQQGSSGGTGFLPYTCIVLDAVICIPLHQVMETQNLSIEGSLAVEGCLEVA